MATKDSEDKDPWKEFMSGTGASDPDTAALVEEILDESTPRGIADRVEEIIDDLADVVAERVTAAVVSCLRADDRDRRAESDQSDPWADME